MDDDLKDRILEAIFDGKLADLKAIFTVHSKAVHAGPWLHRASSQPDVDVVKYLLGLGCDIRGLDIQGNQPLLDAVSFDQPQNVKLLLEHGAAPDPEDSRNVIAAVVGDNQHGLEIIKLLEQYGADIHRVFEHEIAKKKINALSEAIAWGKDDVVEYLKSRGAVLPDQPPPKKGEPRSAAQDIVAYFAEHVGPPDTHSLIEIVPNDPPIEIHFIPSSPDRKFVTLFTTGMSDRPMTVPDDDQVNENYQWAELYLQLPADWPYRKVEDPKFGWPVHWLRSMAQYPHQNDTWLGGAVAVVANGEPPEPIASNTRFNSMLMLIDRKMEIQGRTVQLYRLMPLYPEERELELKKGIGALLRAFDAKGTPMVIDMKRRNVAT